MWTTKELLTHRNNSKQKTRAIEITDPNADATNGVSAAEK
jgi:hypothetical protein